MHGIGGPFSTKMDHLVCFMGGNLALGATGGRPLSSTRLRALAHQDLSLGAELTKSCYCMYNTTPSGLAGEIAYFNLEQGSDKENIETRQRDAHNLMRPETVESLFILWRITGDVKYK